jgi:hypothetical protein
MLFCLIAALAGIAVAQLPPNHSFTGDKVHPWIRTYLDLGSMIWKFPWGLVVICTLIALLIKTRFRGRGLGVAFCVGIAIVLAIRNALR